MAEMFGADPGTLRQLGHQVSKASQLFESTAMRLDGELMSSSWFGRDADSFRGQWASQLKQQLVSTAHALAAIDVALRRQADEQERASAAGSGAAGVGPGAAGSGVYDIANADPGNYGQLDPQIAKDWESLNQDQRAAVLQLMGQDLAKQYGVEGVSYHFENLEEPRNEKGEIAGNLMGVWREDGIPFIMPGRSLYIDTDDMADPTVAINVLAHEMRHAGQHEMARDATVTWWDHLWGNTNKSFDHPGVTKEQAQEFGKNFDNYKAFGAERPGAYFNQPVEVDARKAGHNYVDGLTYEQHLAYKNRIPEIIRVPSSQPGPSPKPPR